MIFGSDYEGAMTYTIALVIQMQTAKFRIDLTSGILATVSRLLYIMLAFFEHFSETKALSIIRAF